MEDLLILTGDAAGQALDHVDLVPPPRPPQFTAGATADLRDAMARFSGPVDHGHRRAVITDLIATFDLGQVTQVAHDEMQTLLGGATVDVAAVSWIVPSYVLATVLGLADRREQVRADTEAIVRVIGRNEPSSAASDEAATRLLDLCAGLSDPIAAVSILYQNHDATSGLIRSAVHEAFSNPAPTGEGSTVRVATKPLTIDGHALAAGEAVRVDLATRRYGAGAHRCPGEALAAAIVAGVVEALRSVHYRMDPAAVELDEAGFPTRLVMSGKKPLNCP